MADSKNNNTCANTVTCPYCGRSITGKKGEDWNSDHVISRRLVPRGFLDGEKRNTVKCCSKCNTEKSHYEQLASACTLWQDCGTPEQDQEIQRKLEGTHHPLTKKNFANSIETHQIKGNFGPATIAFTFTPALALPPEECLVKLGIMILQGVQQIEVWETWAPIHAKVFMHSDWGNAQLEQIKAGIKATKLRRLRTFRNGIANVVVGYEPERLAIIEINKRMRVALKDTPFPPCDDYFQINEQYRVRRELLEIKDFFSEIANQA